jgi:anaerobic magnesium-protoporphyrin IX monomethyl ester cyclase
MSSRIALISVDGGRRDTTSHWPHYGLTLLATRLRDVGFDPRVFDQSFLCEGDSAFLRRIVAFAPDVVGVSLYTTHATRGLAAARALADAIPRARAICGGPHVSLYPTEVEATGLFAALVRGEAECIIPEIVRRTLEGQSPGVVQTGPTPGAAIPEADFGLADGSKAMTWLPIQLSRGCPYNCSFCEVRYIASHRIRYRDVDQCLHEIEGSLGRLAGVYSVSIVDDCPTLDRGRFKRFLRAYIGRGLRARIAIDNMRADSVDEELLSLLKACRIPHVCVAAESGNRRVLEGVDKGETLEEIIRAARLVRASRLPLYLCFVIGLPGATFETEMDSLRLARSLGAEYIYWNMFLPHRGTRAREWFAEHGTIFAEQDHFSVPDYNLRFSLPAVETPEFARRERIRAYVKCVLETVSFVFTPGTIVRAFALAARYGLWSSLPVMLVRMPYKGLFYARVVLGRAYARAGARGAVRSAL